MAKVSSFNATKVLHFYPTEISHFCLDQIEKIHSKSTQNYTTKVLCFDSTFLRVSAQQKGVFGSMGLLKFYLQGIKRQIKKYTKNLKILQFHSKGYVYQIPTTD
jgi:hypothetical protein